MFPLGLQPIITPTFMTTEEQASGENLSPDGDGSIVAELISSEEKADGEAKVEKPKEESKEDTTKPMQMTQKEYQEWKEGQKALNTLLEALGKKDVKTKKPEEALKDVVSDLQRKLEQSRWERDNPAVLKNEEWAKVNEERLDPDHPWHKLDYEDVWKLIKKENPRMESAKKELEHSERNPTDGSVPFFGTGEVVESITDFDKSIQKEMKSKLGYKDSDFE